MNSLVKTFRFDLMGLEDARLTYQHAGCMRELTDIGGQVLTELLSSS